MNLSLGLLSVSAMYRGSTLLWPIPVISITSGSGYSGSVYTSTIAGQWYADDVEVAGETGLTYTMTAANEGKAIRRGESNVIKMWVPSDLDAFAWYDASDITTLYQDDAMTIPVTADGDPVGAIMDKSGNGAHLLQASAALKPTYRTDGTLHWIESDGVDDKMDTTLGSITPGTDPDFCFAAAMRCITAPLVDQRVFEIPTLGAVMAGGFGTVGWAWRYNNGNKIFGPVTLGQDLTVRWQRETGDVYGEANIYINDVNQASASWASYDNSVTVTTNVMSVFDNTLGGLSGTNIRLYGGVVCGALSAPQATSLEAYLATKIGA